MKYAITLASKLMENHQTKTDSSLTIYKKKNLYLMYSIKGSV